MSTPKEIFLQLLQADGRPERQLVQYEALHMELGDPINAYMFGGCFPGNTVKNPWGVTITFPEGAPGPMPVISPETKVCPDVTRWREYVKAPDLEANCSQGWEEAAARASAACGSDRLLTAFMGTGIFEQCHYLMGFEDTLSNLYEHPAEMHELIDYITDYRIDFARRLIDGLHPEVLFTHDDWGTKESLFMSPEMWREFYKEPYRRFYGYIRSRGVIAIHHGDSYLAPIVEDMAEIGIQAWQGVLPENNIPQLQERLQGRMILMGGIGAAIDRADATQEEIGAYVRAVLEEDCPGGHFIPCITYGLPGTVFPHVDPVINSVIEQYNRETHVPGRRAPAVRRQTESKAPEAAKAQDQDQGPILELISKALQKGQRKKLLQLCDQALDSGVSALSILSDALVDGMTKLGEDFSANRAFVPEMLMAARCMSGALERLKPLLAQSDRKAVGRVCLGTVKGDMHDIGKNLVKIMMEGCGLEVVDLGVDVPAEVFVDTAVERQCDIIACSSLLTTSMPEMARVVKLAQDRGIRPRVKIMVGGAPISQSFCQQIGADAFTADAGQAARTAAELLGA